MIRLMPLDKVTALDVRLFFWCNALHRTYALERVVRRISRLGDGYLYAALGIIFALLDGEDGLMLLYAGLIAYAIELPLYMVLKNSIRRVRPYLRFQQCLRFIDPSDTFSFPSGHSAAAFLFATIVSAYYPFLALPVVILALAIASSRVLLGVHYPTDTLAGAVLGISAALTGLYLLPLF